MLKLKCDILLSTSASKFNWRRYTLVLRMDDHNPFFMAGRCRLTLSNPC